MKKDTAGLIGRRISYTCASFVIHPFLFSLSLSLAFRSNRKQTERRHLRCAPDTQVPVQLISHMEENNVIVCKKLDSVQRDWSQRAHLCLHGGMSITSTCENMCRRLEQQHEKEIMNYQWERKRDLRVVTDDTRVLMRQTAILGASRRRRRLLLALVCCWLRICAQLLVLTLNSIPCLVGHDFCLRSRSLPRSLSLSSSFFVSLRVCTCLLCVKMNLVISMSKMTNCHDGLRSRWCWRREKKSCSLSLRSSSSCFHKQLPINVTFHLGTTRTMSTNHFRRCRPYDKVVFWFITLSIGFSLRRTYLFRCHFVAHKSH